MAINKGVEELTDGRYVKDIYHNKPKIYYGEIEVIGPKLPVFTRNGSFTRYLDQGQILKVVSTIEVDAYLGSNEREIDRKEPRGLGMSL